MRSRRAVPILSAAFLAGLAFFGCSDSGGPSGTACTGYTPDLTGTWTLTTLVLAGVDTIPAPPASGTFEFQGDSVDVNLNVPSPPAPQEITIAGKGSCTLKGSRITINSNSPTLGQATGSFTFVDKPPGTADTLTAHLTSQGITNTAVVVRP